MHYKKFLKLITNLLLVISLLGAGFCFSKPISAQVETNTQEDTGGIQEETEEETSPQEEPEPPKNLRILYQGDLADAEGNPIEEGRYNMRFGIYDVAEEGNILWEEEYIYYNAISIKDGQFKIILGRTNPIELDLSQGSFWLGVTIGTVTEEGEISWDKEMEPRKRIIALSKLLEEEGLLEKEELTDKKWEEILQLIKEKLGEQPDLVILFDLEQFGEIGAEEVPGGFSSTLFNLLQNLINFISEKLSEIKDRISEIGEKVDIVLLKLEGIGSVLADIKYKIDVLYDILVVQKGLGSAQIPETSLEEMNYNKQKVESLILKEGETSVRIFNQLVKEESLIFVSFLDEPGSSWWIAEKIPGHSFTISLQEPAPQDIRFDYWILDEEEVKEQTSSPAALPSAGQPEEEIIPAEEQEEQPPVEQPPAEQPSEEEQLPEEVPSEEEIQLEETQPEESQTEEEQPLEEIPPEQEAE